MKGFHLQKLDLAPLFLLTVGIPTAAFPLPSPGVSVVTSTGGQWLFRFQILTVLSHSPISFLGVVMLFIASLSSASATWVGVYGGQYCVRARRSPCQLRRAARERYGANAERSADARVACKSGCEDVGRLEEAQEDAEWEVGKSRNPGIGKKRRK